jgi:adenylate cyclase
MIITYTLPPNPPKRFESDFNSIILGRRRKSSQDTDLDLAPDSYVSKRHARITFENKEYWVEDLGSGNGTWVNGEKIAEKTRLMPEDTLRIGWTNIEVQMEVTPAAEVPEDISAILRAEIPAEADDSATPMADEPSSLPAGEPSSLPAGEPSSLPAGEPATMPEEEPSAEPEEELAAPESATPMADKAAPEEEPPTLPAGEPEPEGDIVVIPDEEIPAAVIAEEFSDTMPTQAWRKLKALNDFSRELGSVSTLESMADLLVKQLQNAMPNAQRGAVLLPDEQGQLLLKAHWPEGDQSVSMTWVNRAFTDNEAFIWAASAPPEGEDDDTPHSALYYDVQSAIYVPLIVGEEALGVMYVDNYYARDAFSPIDLEVLKAIANQVAMFIRDKVFEKGMKREEALRANLLRQFSPKVAEQMVEMASSLQRGGERVSPVTILVSDVRSFTAMSAKMQPDDVVRMLNEMFDAFVPIITEYDGVVDKYVGDSVLAVFGSPEQDPRQWEKAVQAALEMQQAMQMLGQGRKVRRLPVCEVGIGIHTGEVIHGFIGSAERIEFTVIGDTVNRAARYCDGAGPGEVFISKVFYERVYRLVDVQPKTVKTKHPETEGDLEGYIVGKLKEGR